MSKSIYLRGAGRVKAATYDVNGVKSAWRTVGNVSKLVLDPKVSMIEHREDQSGYRFKDLRITDTSDLMVAFTMENFSIDNLAQGFYGDTSTDAGTGTFTATINGGVTVGLDYDFGGPGYTITSITRSDTGATVVPPANYTVNRDGTVTFSVAETLNLTIAGNKAPSSSTTILTRQTPIIALRFEGLNTANSRSSVIVTIPRIGLNPAKSVDFIGNQISKLELDGDALYDPNLVSSGILSGYGTIALA